MEPLSERDLEAIDRVLDTPIRSRRNLSLRAKARNAVNLDQDTLEWVIRFIDKSPAVTWSGKGGAKERLLAEVDRMSKPK